MLQVMKFGLASAVVALSAARLCPWCGGSPVGAATLAAAEVQAPDTAVARFGIQGMTCGSCATTARVALQRLAGVYRANISYDSASAVVRYDARRVNPTQIVQHLERLTGYRATLLAGGTATQPRPRSR